MGGGTLIYLQKAKEASSQKNAKHLKSVRNKDQDLKC